MRILFVPWWYPPRSGQREVSGVFVREHALAAATRDEVRVLAFRMSEGASGPTTAERYSDGPLEVMDVTVRSGSRSLLRTVRLRMLWALHLGRAVAAWGRPDVIHSQDHSSFYCAPSARLLRSRHVISHHWTGFQRRAVSPYLAGCFRRAFAAADLVLCSNFDARSDLGGYGIACRCEWMPNAFDTSVYHPGDGARDASLVHVSGFSDQKRVPDILRAFGEVLRERPGAFLHLVGDGSGRAAAEAEAARLLPAGSHAFHGFLPGPEVAGLLRRAGGFVFPSSAETFGCALMEAMACGCPVLTTRVGGIPAVVREGEGILVEPGDIDSIRAGMIALLDGSHGLDTAALARSTAARFGRDVVGSLLHGHYLRLTGS